MTTSLSSPLTLPCGVTLSNRFCKASMTEGLADADDRVTERLVTLYGRWADGGAGALFTGNVMVDRNYLERPGNVVIDGNGGLEQLRKMAEAGKRAGNQIWMQINHPGRQCTRVTSNDPVAPSAVGVRGMMGMMAVPRALTDQEIESIIDRWASVAAVAKDTGFTGVQVHSAHGYLSSQFLSPLVNRRTDRWGGPLENRARFLTEVVKAVRGAVGPAFPVGVKLNSSDFQKGGFSSDESVQVATWLHELGVDLLEISGGTYEQMALQGRLGEASSVKKAASTRAREAYFLEYAKMIRAAVPALPLMVTGGFRSVDVMNQALEAGELDVVGIARPFCLMPDLPQRILSGQIQELPAPEKTHRLGPGIFSQASPIRGMRTLNSQAEAAWFYRQIILLSEGKEPDPSITPWVGLLAHLRDDFRLGRARSFKKRRKALAADATSTAG